MAIIVMSKSFFAVLCIMMSIKNVWNSSKLGMGLTGGVWFPCLEEIGDT